MNQFDENSIVNGKFYSLWVDGELYAEVKTGKATSELESEDVVIAGRFGKGTRVTGGNGSGSLTFWQCYNGLKEKINDALKSHKAFNFDLTSMANDPDVEGSERVVIEKCKITKFDPINFDISKLMEDSFDFKYDIEDVRYE